MQVDQAKTINTMKEKLDQSQEEMKQERSRRRIEDRERKTSSFRGTLQIPNGNGAQNGSRKVKA